MNDTAMTNTDGVKQVEPKEWQFASIVIEVHDAPQEIMGDVEGVLKAQAENGQGLFGNVTDTPMEDESEDELLMIEVYECRASLSPYWNTLKTFDVVGRGDAKAFLNPTMRKTLLLLLNDIVTFIKDHSDRPAKAKNRILEVVKKLDEIPVWGLFLQILLIQGVLTWMEGISLNEGDTGYSDAQAFYEWAMRLQADKLIHFIYTPYGDNDKKRLQPLCNYLLTTSVGQCVQRYLFGSEADRPNLPQREPEPKGGATIHPEQESAPDVKLQRFLECVPTQSKKKAERLLQRVIKEGYCTANYEWIASKWKSGKGRLALTCFSYLASQYLEIKPYEYAHNKNKVESETRKATNWQAFEMLFEYDGKKADKSGRYYQLADVWKQRCKYNEQERFYQCPEMIEIKKLFNNK